VVVIGEDYDRSLALLKELHELGVRTEFWNTGAGALCPTKPPSLGAVYFSRQSPSADARGHPQSISYTASVLRWLEAYGCVVVNGSAACAMEMSKCAQMQTLAAHGINTPWTLLVISTRQLVRELRGVAPSVPLVLKPDTGGSGNHVHAFPDGRTAAYAVVHGIPAAGPGQEGVPPLPDHFPWVVQEHIGPYSSDPAKLRSVLRFEIVNGKVLYVMQIKAPVTLFKLCPCDPRSKSILERVDFKLLRNPYSIPCFAGRPGSYEAFCGKLEAVWASVGARVGAAEAFLPPSLVDEGPREGGWVDGEDGTADGRTYSREATVQPGEPVVFELNFNSNYNRAAEELAGVSAMHMVALMLRDLATRQAASTCPSSSGWDTEGLMASTVDPHSPPLPPPLPWEEHVPTPVELLRMGEEDEGEGEEEDRWSL